MEIIIFVLGVIIGGYGTRIYKNRVIRLPVVDFSKPKRSQGYSVSKKYKPKFKTEFDEYQKETNN